jgi:hypothetical protein
MLSADPAVKATGLTETKLLSTETHGVSRVITGN